MLPHVLTVFAVAALGVVAQNSANKDEKPFALATPGELVQCKNTTIVWQGGQAPYKLSLTPVCGAGKNATEETHTILEPGSTSIEIPITFLADTPLIVSITDSNNMQATAPESIVASGDANDSCSTQTACTATEAPSAPSVPIAAASPSASRTATMPTDRLVTSDPSSTSYVFPSSSIADSSVVLLYSYVTPSQPATRTGAPTGTSLSQANAAVPAKAAPTAVVLGCIVLVGANLLLGLW